MHQTCFLISSSHLEVPGQENFFILVFTSKARLFSWVSTLTTHCVAAMLSKCVSLKLSCGDRRYMQPFIILRALGLISRITVHDKHGLGGVSSDQSAASKQLAS